MVGAAELEDWHRTGVLISGLCLCPSYHGQTLASWVLTSVVLKTVSSFLYVKPCSSVHGVLIFMLNLATVYRLCVELHVKPCSNVHGVLILTLNLTVVCMVCVAMQNWDEEEPNTT